jgi:hypothetical protein
MAKTFPVAMASVKKYLKPCPLLGPMMFEDFRFNSSMLPSFLLPSGDFRLDVRMFNGKNETIYSSQYFVTIKNQFF